MKIALSLLALPIAAIASPFVLEARKPKPNNIPLIRGNLTRISKYIVDLNKTLNTVPPTQNWTADFSRLLDDAEAISGGLVNITALANVSRHATHEESNQVYRYLNQSIYKNSVALLDNFNVYFDSLNNGSLAIFSLYFISLIQNNTDLAGAALTKIASVHIKKKAPKLLSNFDAAFNKSIALYEKGLNLTYVPE